MKTALLVTLLFSSPGMRAAGQAISFLRPHYIEIGGQCCSVLTADFNGDGKPDIVAANGAQGLTVLFGKGDGTFTRKDNVIPGFVISGLVAIADLNLDGKADIVATLNNGRNIALLGRGDGSFQAPIDIGPEEIKAVADFNGDGKPDLLVYPVGLFGFSVRLGIGDGTFQKSGQLMQFPTSHINYDVVGDFNHDGKLDVAQISIRVSNEVFIWLGKGDGTFDRTTSAKLSPDANTAELAVGDFNGDGITDLAVIFVSAVGNPLQVELELLLGRGDGSFQPGPIYPFEPSGDGWIVADFNGDGKEDFARGFIIFLGNGDGTLRAGVTFGQPMHELFDINASVLAAADFNGDGKLDLVGPGLNGTDLSVLISDTPGTDNSVGAVSAATYGDIIAPGSIATVFGKGLAQATSTAPGFPLPVVLQNTSVRILDQKGVERLASLFYVSPSQINFQVPPETTASYYSFAVINVDKGNAPQFDGGRATRVQPIAPGFFTMDGSGHGLAAATAVRVLSNGTQVPVPVIQCSAPGACSPVAIDLSGDGTVYLSLYGTGFAEADPGTSCQIGSSTVLPSYSGPQGEFPGLDQLNLPLPKTLPRGMVDIRCNFRWGSPITAANDVTVLTK